MSRKLQVVTKPVLTHSIQETHWRCSRGGNASSRISKRRGRRERTPATGMVPLFPRVATTMTFLAVVRIAGPAYERAAIRGSPGAAMHRSPDCREHHSRPPAHVGARARRACRGSQPASRRTGSVVRPVGARTADRRPRVGRSARRARLTPGDVSRTRNDHVRERVRMGRMARREPRTQRGYGCRLPTTRASPPSRTTKQWIRLFLGLDLRHRKALALASCTSHRSTRSNWSRNVAKVACLISSDECSPRPARWRPLRRSRCTAPRDELSQRFGRGMCRPAHATRGSSESSAGRTGATYSEISTGPTKADIA